MRLFRKNISPCYIRNEKRQGYKQMHTIFVIRMCLGKVYLQFIYLFVMDGIMERKGREEGRYMPGNK